MHTATARCRHTSKPRTSHSSRRSSRSHPRTPSPPDRLGGSTPTAPRPSHSHHHNTTNSLSRREAEASSGTGALEVDAGDLEGEVEAEGNMEADL